jgi:hypothetical protein
MPKARKRIASSLTHNTYKSNLSKTLKVRPPLYLLKKLDATTDAYPKKKKKVNLNRSTDGGSGRGIRIGSAYRGVSAEGIKLKTDPNQSSGGRVQTPTSIGAKKTTKIPDKQIGDWLEMTDKRSKIYDDMMKHMKAENYAKIGPKVVIKKKPGHGDPQGQVFSNGTGPIGEGKFTKCSETIQDQ